MIPCGGRPARILLVEDDWVTARILKYTLEKSGYGVEVVTSGKAAAEETVRLQPDAVILDLNLPDLPGSEVLRRIRAAEVDGPSRRAVLILSARTYEGVPASLDQADALETKPIAPSTLLGRLAGLNVPPWLLAPAHAEGPEHERC